MPIKFIVRSVDDGTIVTEQSVEDQDHILIGRDTSAQVTLPDPDKLVSRLHAEIRKAGEGHQLADLGSRNFTYLGTKRLEVGRQYPVKSGDKFKIGNFEIEFIVVQRQAADFEQTIIDPAFINPLVDRMRDVAMALRELDSAYEEIAETRRAVALMEAIDDLPEPPRLDPELSARLSAAFISPKGAAGARETSGVSSRPSSPVATAGLDSIGRMAMGHVSRLIKIPWQFRHEFIGQTIVVSPESQAIFESDGEGLIDFVFDRSADDAESARRLEMLTEAIDDVITHQVAVLDGYRASVRDGANALLDEVDPMSVDREVKEGNPLFARIPFLALPTMLRRLKEVYRNIRNEDWSVVERRTYRPAFIKAYLARMTSGRGGRSSRGEK